MQAETIVVILTTACVGMGMWALIVTGAFLLYLRKYETLVQNYVTVSNDIIGTFNEVSRATDSLIDTIDKSCTLSKENKGEILTKLGEMEQRMTETIHRNSQLMSALAHNDVNVFNTQQGKGNVAQGGSASQDIG